MPEKMTRNIQIVIPSNRAGTISWLCQQLHALNYRFQITDLTGYWSGEKEPCKCVSLYYKTEDIRPVFRAFATTALRLQALGEETVMTIEDGRAYFYRAEDRAALEVLANAERALVS